MASQLESRRSARSGRRSAAEADERARRRYQELEAFDRERTTGPITTVAGVDEAGRGALAGPVVCAAVILPPGSDLLQVDDSKAVAEDKRERLFDEIVRSAVSVGVAFSQPAVIDRENILQATLMAMHRAVDGLGLAPDLVLVDGRDRFQWRGRLVTVTKGDSQSLSIAAASIVAKVARDRAMRRLHRRYPEYNFEQNKGYGTRDHLEALSRLGPADVHRRSFLGKTVDPNLTMF